MSPAVIGSLVDVAVALFVISPVNQIEEQPCVLLIELAMPHLINNQTGRADQTVENRRFLSGPAGGGKLVPQFGHLYEIGLNASLTGVRLTPNSSPIVFSFNSSFGTYFPDKIFSRII